MSEEDTSSPSNGAARKLVINYSKKVAVPTSAGTVFVRRLTVDDFETFTQAYSDVAAAEAAPIGAVALQTLSGTVESAEDRTPLADEVLAALSEADRRALAAAIAETSSMGELPDGPADEALGGLVKAKFEELAKTMTKAAADLKTALEGSVGLLSKAVQSTLKDRVEGLAAIKDSLWATSASEAARRLQEGRGASAIGDLFKTGALGQTGTVALKRAIADLDANRLKVESTAVRAPTFYEPPRIEIPPVEKTPMGRAAIASEEAARQLQEVTGLTAAMAAQMAELSQVVVTQAVPELLNKLADDRKAEQRTLEQARDSLRWTKWAVIASVVVTVAVTAWQLWVARAYKLENDGQQRTTEALMRQQLETARALNQRLAEDSQRLQEAIRAMNAKTTATDASAVPPGRTSAGKATQSR